MKKIIVYSKRLMIRPKTLEEMQEIYEKEQDVEMKQAYLEMIEEMKKIVPNEEWGADWAIYLKDELDHEIGGIGFKGVPNSEGNVEIGYGINPEYQHQGYATEAVAAMIEWAFKQKHVNCVQAQIEAWNEISRKVLLKNGLKEVGMGSEGPLFEIKNPKRL